MQVGHTFVGNETRNRPIPGNSLGASYFPRITLANSKVQVANLLQVSEKLINLQLKIREGQDYRLPLGDRIN